MKQLVFSLFVTGLAITTLSAQTPATDARLSGKITYEGMRQIDRSQMRMVVNGQEVRPRVDSPGSPGTPDAPEGVPEVMSFSQKLVFAGTMAKEERDQPQNRMRQVTVGGPGAGNDQTGGSRTGGSRTGGSRNTRMRPPFDQTTYLDLANRQRIDVMTIRKDSASQTYRTDRPMPKAEGWQETGKTKKIAGYLCRKATAKARISTRGMYGGAGQERPGQERSGQNAPEQTYTIWYTTELPFTYSPIASLTPEKGVVLQIESDTESFKATNMSMEAVDAATVQPPTDAKVVSSDEMNDMRRKAMADFRQKMTSNGPLSGTGRN
jgi:GLPGLI family protein